MCMLNNTDVRQCLKYRISWPSLAATSMTLAGMSTAWATRTGSRTSERFSTFTLVLRIDFQRRADTVRTWNAGWRLEEWTRGLFRIRNPVSVLSPGLNRMSEEIFGWVKPVACGHIWENLMSSSILCLFAVFEDWESSEYWKACASAVNSILKIRQLLWHRLS